MTEPREPEFFMKAALKEAGGAARRGEVPVGAVLVRSGKIIARAGNRTRGLNDPTAHAEILALRKAARKLDNHRLGDCDLYVTLEPCAMCLGAAVQARIGRIFYGADDPKAGAVHSILTFPFDKTNHRIEIKSGILAPECAIILKVFFQARR